MGTKKNVAPAAEKGISLASLSLEQAILEVRSYNRTFMPGILADFWDSVERQLEVPIVYGFQDQASVSRIGRSKELAIDQEKFSVVQHFPSKDLSHFFDLCSRFYDLYIEHMKSERLTRVGFRVIYAVDLGDPQTVAEEFFKLPYISVPEGLTLAGTGKPLMPTYYVGYNDGQKVMVYRLKGSSGKLEIDLPLILTREDSSYPEKIERTYNRFIFDVDVYTLSPVLPGELVVSEWLAQAYEAVQADTKCFFQRDKDVR